MPLPTGVIEWSRMELEAYLTARMLARLQALMDADHERDEQRIMYGVPGGTAPQGILKA